MDNLYRSRSSPSKLHREGRATMAHFLVGSARATPRRSRRITQFPHASAFAQGRTDGKTAPEEPQVAFCYINCSSLARQIQAGIRQRQAWAWEIQAWISEIQTR